MKNKLGWAAVVLGCLWGAGAQAADGVAAELGNGDATDMARAALQWQWQEKWLERGGWHLGGYWDAALGYWHAHSAAGGNHHITDIGITPVFRFQQGNPGGCAPYLEAAIGAHLISKTEVNADRKLGSALQFGSHVGAGVRFGGRGEYDISYRFQHLSNGGIKSPNQGINFNQIRFSYWFK